MNSIIGQEKLKRQLHDSVYRNHVSHAYLFTGPDGIGKKTIANAFAAMLLCMNPGKDSACGCCQSCLLIKNSSNPDLLVIEAEEGKNEIPVSAARAMKDDAYTKPLICSRKVYIIIDAEKMNVNAQNCILKLLEEPNQYITIILTSQKPEVLLDTIKSRVIGYSLERSKPDEIRSYISENIPEAMDNLNFIVNASDGIIGKASEIASSPGMREIRDNLFRLIRSVYSGEDDELRQLFRDNRDNLDFIFNIMSTIYRDILVYKNTCDENLLINSDKKDMIIKCADDFTAQYLMNAGELLDKVKNDIEYNAHYNNTIDYMLMNLQEDICRK